MEQDLTINEIDLTNCDREPIHLLGKVQSVGALMVLTSDWILINASSNLDNFCRCDAKQGIGEDVANLIKSDALRAIRDGVKNIGSEDQTERRFALNLFKKSDELFDCAFHFSRGQLIIDIEPHVASQSQRYLQILRKSLQVLSVTDSFDAFFQSATNTIGSMLGFDRVMLYKFHPDDTGEVIAETRTSNVDSFMGLRYPASDIPKQARQLYLRNITRLIADVGDESVPLIHNEAVDLSLSTLRAVSPMHIEYLKNMGVSSSMSISVVVDGKLWGLFALHHYQPRYVSLELRSIAEVFAESFSMELNARIHREQQEEVDVGKTLHLQMMSTLDIERSVFENFRQHLSKIKDLIDCSSLVLSVDEITAVEGDPVVDEDIRLLVSRLNRLNSSDIISNEHLVQFLSSGSLGDRFAGMLAIPISRRPRDYLIFLRKEEPYEVRWAGNPEKPVELAPNGSRLTPRKSFETWQELRRGFSKPWSRHEKTIALQIKHTLLEVIVRNVDERERLAHEANQRQDILVQELNHRVRNILGLINSVVTQTAAGVGDVEEFKKVLGGRIQSLANAQNQLTARNWGFTPLNELLDINLRPYRGTRAKIELLGPEVMLSPKAFTTLSLVLHELVTNAVKYGALSIDNGCLRVSWFIYPTGGLRIDWSESGVVLRDTPSHRGFGSLIIDRSISADLGGNTKMEFLSSGLHVEFDIPANHIADEPNQNNLQRSLEETEQPNARSLRGKVSLMLEDNMIIGLDLEQTLYKVGFGQVLSASSVREAMQLLVTKRVDFAVLDINLGHEMSFEVAKHLQEHHIPFVFLTGYSELKAETSEHFKDVPVLIKPMQAGQLIRTVQHLLQ